MTKLYYLDWRRDFKNILYFKTVDIILSFPCSTFKTIENYVKSVRGENLMLPISWSLYSEGSLLYVNLRMKLYFPLFCYVFPESMETPWG